MLSCLVFAALFFSACEKKNEAESEQINMPEVKIQAIEVGSQTFKDFSAKVNLELQGIESPRTDCKDKFKRSQFPHGGLRVLWCHTKQLNLINLKSVIGEPVFLDSPHNDSISFNEAKSFGYYNPKFLEKTIGLVKAIDTKSDFFKYSKKMYDKYFRKTLRTQYIVGLKIQSNGKWLKSETEFYNRIIKLGEPIEGRLVFYETILHPNYFTSERKAFLQIEPALKKKFPLHLVATATGFWVRRAIKDQFPLMWQLHESLIEKYDSEFKRASAELLSSYEVRLAQQDKEKKDLIRQKLKNSNLPEGTFLKNLDKLPMTDDEQL